MGYSPWSAFDLISTHERNTRRYGLIDVDRDEFDRKEMSRRRKDSFFWYQKASQTEPMRGSRGPSKTLRPARSQSEWLG